MKRYSILFVITGLVVSVFLLLPTMVLQMVPEVIGVRLRETTYTEKIYASGKLEETQKATMTYDIPLVAEEVFVGVGDTVQTGDVMATIDMKQTKQALFSLVQMTNSLSTEAWSALANLALEESWLEQIIPREIKAEASGVITGFHLAKGAVLGATQTAAEISGLSDLRAKLSVSEQDARQIQVDQKVTVFVKALDNLPLQGTVSKIFPTANDILTGVSQQTVVYLYVTLKEQDVQCKSGYNITAQIQVGQPRTLSVVPYEAVGQDEDGKEFVYVYENGRATKRHVQTGLELEDAVQVTDGLTTQDIVLLSETSLHDRKRVYLSKVR